jgi:hypothetical protein
VANYVVADMYAVHGVCCCGGRSSPCACNTLVAKLAMHGGVKALRLANEMY